MPQEVKKEFDHIASALSLLKPELHQAIWDYGVIKLEGSHRLKSHEDDPDHEESPYYYSFRQKDVKKGIKPNSKLTYFQWLMHFGSFGIVLNNWHELGREKGIDIVAGVPEAANKLAVSFTNSTNVPRIEFGKETVDENRKVTSKIVKGRFKPGQRLLIIDDALTSGKSFLETAEAAYANDLEVVGVWAVVDREEGGLDNLRRHPLLANVKNIGAVTTTTEVLAAGNAPEDKVRQILEYAQRQREKAA